MSSSDASFTGSIPEHYDRHLGPVLFVDYAADIARRTAAGGPMRVLETAAGTGIVTRALRDALPEGARLTATDLNPPMLEIARTKLRPGEAVDFQPADAQALPFPDGSFDAVVCQFGLMFYPDKPKSARETFRVLAPGGRYLFNVWDAHRHNPFAGIAHGIAERLFPADPPQFYKVPFSCSAIDPVKDMLVEAGFEGIAISVLGRKKEVPDIAHFARGVIFGNPLSEQIRARGADPEKAYDLAVAELRAAFGDKPALLPLQAMVFEARKPG